MISVLPRQRVTPIDGAADRQSLSALPKGESVTTVDDPRIDQPYQGVVEIRIHGVSGTPPGELLDRQIVTEVAGDESAGFYQPAVDSQRRDRPHGSTGDRGPWLEAFSWAGLTSGSWSRALWILLLPFGLINVAPYAVPGPAFADEDCEESWQKWHRYVAVLCRILAGSLTAAIAMGASGVGMLTIGTRCATTAAVRGCYGLPLWVSDLLGTFSRVGQWVAGAAIPLLMVAGLMFISRRSDRGESVPEPLHQTVSSAQAVPGRMKANPNSEFELAKPGLWERERASRQRGTHAQIALLVVGLICGWPLTDGSILRWLVLSAATIVITCDLILLVRQHQRGNDPLANGLHTTGWVGLCLLAVVVAVSAVTGTIGTPDALMVWFDVVLRWGFIGQAVVVIAIFLSIAVMRSKTQRPRRGRTSQPLQRAGGGVNFNRLFLRGWSTAVFASFAWLLGAASTTGLMIAVPSWLATPGLVMGPNQLARTMAARPAWFASSAGSSGFGILVVVIVGLIAAVCCLFWVAWSVWLPWGAGRSVDRRNVMEVYADDLKSRPTSDEGAQGPSAEDHQRRSSWRYWRSPRFAEWPQLDDEQRRRATEVARIFWWARRVDYVPRLIGVVGGLAAVCLIVIFFIDEVRTDWLRWVPATASALPDGELRPVGLTAAIAWGIWLAASGLVAIVLLSLLATRDSSLRRHIGIIWDVASFWPRDTHPLAPPCYSERAIPQLVHRMRFYVGDLAKHTSMPGSDGSAAADMNGVAGAAGDTHHPSRCAPRRVIVAGHSQGSVIGVAAIMTLPTSARSKVALLTYGSVLTRLYGRFFPLYFGPAELAKVADALLDEPGGKVRWRNLYRYSDFLGGPIDRHLDDPEQLADIDRRYPDPLFRSSPGDSIYPAAGRHSRFERDPSFQAEIGQLVGRFGRRYECYEPAMPEREEPPVG